MIDQLLLAAVLVLSVALARASYKRGHRKGYFDCMVMVTEAAEENARQELRKQREMVARMRAVDAQEDAWERHAAEVAPWN